MTAIDTQLFATAGDHFGALKQQLWMALDGEIDLKDCHIYRSVTQCLVIAHTFLHMHKCMRAHSHTHTHTHLCLSLSLSLSLSLTHTHTHTHRACMYTLIHTTCIYTHTYTHTHKQTKKCVCVSLSLSVLQAHITRTHT